MNFVLIIIVGCLLTFVATIIGASVVFFIKKDFSKKLACLINVFASGVMFSASVFGLIIPSFEHCSNWGSWNFIPCVIGMILGCLFLLLIDIIVKRTHKQENNLQSDFQNKSKLIRFFIAITVHNIPEGMAVGFAFGNALTTGTQSSLIIAFALALAIAIQNIPEGITVALPIYKETKSKRKAFGYSVLSGSVEPIFAVLGILLASQVKILLPWLLTFSAGAMIFVTIDDLVPESKHEHSHVGSWSFIIGFLVMMILDVALG